MNSPQPLLQATDVYKSYRLARREIPVLRGVDLVANQGDFVALRGSSGAGKSTLLHVLGALDSPDRGKVVLESVEISSGSAAVLSKIRNTKIGFVFQAYHLLPELDALENVCLPGRMARRMTSECVAKGRDLLQRVGLGARMEHRPYELSGGEQQRVAIARALINDPVLLLADEPTGNLDSKTGQEIIDLLVELQAERKMTLIMATHSSEMASRAPRVVDLIDGRVA